MLPAATLARWGRENQGFGGPDRQGKRRRGAVPMHLYPSNAEQPGNDEAANSGIEAAACERRGGACNVGWGAAAAGAGPAHVARVNGIDMAGPGLLRVDRADHQS